MTSVRVVCDNETIERALGTTDNVSYGTTLPIRSPPEMSVHQGEAVVRCDALGGSVLTHFGSRCPLTYFVRPALQRLPSVGFGRLNCRNMILEGGNAAARFRRFCWRNGSMEPADPAGPRRRGDPIDPIT
jgi:hypothetical protein